METPSDPSTIDMLIARMETHPEEFFDSDTLLETCNLRQSLRGKWGAFVARLLGQTDARLVAIVSPNDQAALSQLFSAEELTRLSDALRKMFRQAVDAEIVRAVVAGEGFGQVVCDKKYAQQAKKASQVFSSGSIAAAQGYTTQQYEDLLNQQYEQYVKQGVTAGNITGTSVIGGLQNASNTYIANTDTYTVASGSIEHQIEQQKYFGLGKIFRK